MTDINVVAAVASTRQAVVESQLSRDYLTFVELEQLAGHIEDTAAEEAIVHNLTVVVAVPAAAAAAEKKQD